MKRVFGIFIMLFVLLLVGCGNTKKLECSYKDDSESEFYSLTYTKDGALKSVTYKILEEDYIDGELTTSERAELNSECDGVPKSVDCKVNIKGNDVELVMHAEGIDKMTIDEIEEADLDDFTDYTYEELKEELIDMGFSCK